MLFEAAAICLHIADQAAGAGLAPPPGSNERAHFYKWLFFLSNTVQPAYMTFRYAEQHAAPATAGATPHPSAVDAVRAAAAERTSRAFEVIEEMWGTGPFMLGERYSACDAYLYMLTWWGRKLPRPPGALPRVRACVEAVARRPATQRACASEGIDVQFDA